MLQVYVCRFSVSHVESVRDMMWRVVLVRDRPNIGSVIVVKILPGFYHTRLQRTSGLKMTLIFTVLTGHARMDTVTFVEFQGDVTRTDALGHLQLLC